MKVFSFFTEPASYTIDLIDNVYDVMSIEYCFLNSHSEAYSNFKEKPSYLVGLFLFTKYTPLRIIATAKI